MKLTMLCIGSFLLALAGCSTVHSQDGQLTATTTAAARTPPGSIPVDPLPNAVTRLPNVVCRKQHEDWNPTCTSDDLNINIDKYGCSQGGFFGVIAAHGASSITLWDRIPSPEAIPVAKLKGNQFVCISGDATLYTGGERLWLYVTAIPTQTVNACKGNENCKAADLAVEWLRPTTGRACQPDPTDHYVGDCPSGWVRTRDVGEFSMGL